MDRVEFEQGGNTVKHFATGERPKRMTLIGVVTGFVVLTLAMAAFLLPSPVGTLQIAYADGDRTCNPLQVPAGETITDEVIEGNLLVPTGSEKCTLVGVHVKGNIIVGHSSVRLEVTLDSEVDGNIESPSGTVFVDDSTVHGNIYVDDCGGTITVKDSQIDGNVVLTGNGSVVVTGNTINGNLDLIGNTLVTEVDNDVDGNTKIE